MSKWFFALQFTFAYYVSVNSNRPGYAESDPRYAVMQFDGITEFPRGSKFAVGSDAELVLPAETITTPVRLVLIADRTKNEGSAK